MPLPLQPRQRKQVRYSEATPSKNIGRSESDSDHTATLRSGSSSGSDSSGDEQPEAKEVRLMHEPCHKTCWC